MMNRGILHIQYSKDNRIMMNPGDKIGNYRVLHLIGEGGMASVYEAEHETLGRRVAIKALNPMLSSQKSIRDRFRNEARMMEGLEHPGITRILDFYEQGDELALVMELLKGEDLSKRVKQRGPLQGDEAFSVFRQVLSAFQFAHDKGVVHRDIKPSNIFMNPDGQVKILDFGIAKLLSHSMGHTRTGSQMGTPLYMSPEQVKDPKDLDHRSDIYSLGVTLYYLLKGKPPYDSDAESDFSIFNKIVFEPLPELSSLGKWEGIVGRACCKDPSERYSSCSQWLQALDSVQGKGSGHDRPAVGAITDLEATVVDGGATTRARSTPSSRDSESTRLEAEPMRRGVHPPNQGPEKPQSEIGGNSGSSTGAASPPNAGHVPPLPQEKQASSVRGVVLGIVALAVLCLLVWKLLQPTGDNEVITEEVVAEEVIAEEAPSKDGGYETFTIAGETIQVAKEDFSSGMNWDDAMSSCERLGNGWRLPTSEELEAMYEQLHKQGKGNFRHAFYWSSSQDYSGSAWAVYFFTGYVNSNGKNYSFRVRAVRALP